MDLEAPDPVVAAEPEPIAEPVVAAEPVVDPITQEPEDAVDVEGQKHVPLGTLIAERREKQALKAKADQYDQIAGYVQQVRPYIDFLQANPGLMTRTAEHTTPAPVTTTQPVDAKAETLARTLDLYTADGKPDVTRAQAILTTIDDAADAKADAKIKPLQESTTRERSQFMYQRALVTKAPDGRAVDRSVLDAIWSRTDPNISATEEGAAGIVALALGLSVMQGTSPAAVVAAPLTAPLHTDPAGGRNQVRAPLSKLDQDIAKLRGLSEKDYAERSKGFTPGRNNTLED